MMAGRNGQLTLTHHHRRPAGRALGRRFADILSDPIAGDQAPVLLGRPDVVPFEAVPFAMVVTNSEAHALASNKRWTDLSGITASSSLGEGWLHGLGSDEASEVTAAVRKVGTTGTPARFRCSVGTMWANAYRWAGETLVGVAILPPTLAGWTRKLVAELLPLCDDLERVLNTVERELVGTI
jgi:hypothetical protein